MTTSQILLYAFLALLVVFYVRRFLLTRTIPRYTAMQLADRMKETGWTLLDVRTARERQAQSIRGSLHIPVQELQRRAGELDKYRDREVICYCQSGNRSLVAALRLRRLGFNAAHLEGGIGEWNYMQKN
jgi:rhodanese-related sulfurtransferase